MEKDSVDGGTIMGVCLWFFVCIFIYVYMYMDICIFICFFISFYEIDLWSIFLVIIFICVLYMNEYSTCW